MSKQTRAAGATIMMNNRRALHPKPTHFSSLEMALKANFKSRAPAANPDRKEPSETPVAP
jgi:hypothetical protein